ncbi:MAG: DUF2868 domain-containing protein [Lautropia sp.]
MNEHDARQALLVRAIESAPRTALWTDDDRDWASREAARLEGENADTQAFVARRAASAVERLSTRSPGIASMLHALAWRPWAVPACMLGAFLLGLLLDAVAADRRINILAPPLLALLLWNLLVYLAMLVGALRTRAARGDVVDRPGPIARAFARIVGHAASRAPAQAAAPVPQFLSAWATMSAPLTAARSRAGLHLSAAAFAAGALAGLYFRGLAFEYLAGWESTFLDAPGVERLLGIVLGPASLLGGIALPDAAHLATLRFSQGAGENAARWIHLHAITIALFVIVPRVVLGVLDSTRARRLAAEFPIPLSDIYFQGLERRRSGTRASVDALPYSISLREAGVTGLQRRLRALFGADAEIRIGTPIALGREDDLPRLWAPTAGTSLVLALYSMSATPEIETHGQFLRRLAEVVAGRAPIAVLIDESAMRQRFGGDATRLESRRSAWRRMCVDVAGVEPAFAWLEGATDEEGDGVRASLRKVIDEISVRMGQNAGMNTASIARDSGPAT